MVKRSIYFILSVMVTTGALLIPTVASASGDIVVSREFLAFSVERGLYAIRVTDVNRGTYFSVRKLEDSSIVKEVPYQLEDEDKALKSLKKAHKLTDEGHVGQQSPNGEYTILGAAKGDKFEVMVQADSHLGLVRAVDLRKEQDSEKPAKAILKQVVWTPDGKWLLLVINQKVGGAFSSDEDDVIVMPFRSYKVQWQ